MPRIFQRLSHRLLACVSLLLWSCLSLAVTATPQPLHVVSDDNYPPYLFKDANGQPQGYLVALWALWSQKTGRPVTLTATAWAKAQQMLQDGEADVIDMIFRTPGREPLYHFSPPYARLPVTIYAHESVKGVRNVQALAGFRVGVQEGDACIEQLRARGVTDVVTFASYQHIIDAALAQQVKLFCMDQFPGDHYLYRNQQHKAYLKAFELYEGQFHRAVRHGAQDTLAQVEAGMARITPAELSALEARWLQPTTDWRDIGYHSLLLLLGIAAAGGVTFLWVRGLRRAVRERTAELQRERARLNAVVRGIPDLLWLKDTQGVYLGCNPAFERLYGAAEADILGKTDRDFVDEATAQGFRHHDQKAMMAEVPLANEEWLTFADDGRRRLYETVKTAMRDEQGRVMGVLGVARDITERKRATEELDLLRHHLEEAVAARTAELQRTAASLRTVASEQEAVFVAAPVGIAMLRQRQVERCNPRLEQIFGVAPGRLIGQSTRDWFVDDASFDAIGRLYPSLLAGERMNQTVLMRRHGGDVFWAQVHAQVIDVSDPDKGVLAVIEDTTAEHEAAEALRLARAQAEMGTRLKSTFLSNISHEVRTPLNAILGMTHLAQQATDEAERRACMTHVHSAGQHLLHLFNDLLELSRFEAGQVQLTTSVFDVRATLEGLVAMQLRRATERGLALRLAVANDVPQRLVGDAVRLSQALLVYLDNAIKFSSQGEVVLEAGVQQLAKGRVRLRLVVRDQGAGLSAAQQQSLFRAFEQQDGSLTRTHGGLGIGLGMVARIANLMDGEVGVDSAPGQGSAFRLVVWLGLPENEAPQQRLLRVPGRRALLATVDSSLSAHLVPMLRGFGLVVDVVASGPDALRHVHRASQIGQAVDFVFLDATLPDGGGWQTARMLQALELPQALKTFLLADGPQTEATERHAGAALLDRQPSASTVWDVMALSMGSAQDAPAHHPMAAQPLAAASIDTEAGLHQCDGKPSVYRHLLQQFADVYPQTLQQLRSGDMATVLRALHLLKGHAQALGAHALQGLSAGVEQLLATQPSPPEAGWTQAPALVELVGEVERVAAQLPAVLARVDETGSADADADASAEAEGEAASAQGAWLAELEQALVSGDLQALALANQHPAGLQQLVGGRTAEWRQALAQYDFDTALQLLREAQAGRQ